MKICKIFSFFWPVLCGPKPIYREILFSEINIDEEQIDKTLELILRVYDSEQDRKKIIENKSISIYCCNRSNCIY